MYVHMEYHLHLKRNIHISLSLLLFLFAVLVVAVKFKSAYGWKSAFEMLVEGEEEKFHLTTREEGMLSGIYSMSLHKKK